MLPEVVARLRRRHPGIAIQLSAMSSLEERAALVEGRIDASFGNDPPNDPRLESQPLFAERVMVALPRDHRLAGRRAVTLRDVADEPIVWMARSDVPEVFQGMWDRLRARGFGATVALEARTVHTRLALVAAGLGITVEVESSAPILPDSVVLRPVSDLSVTFDIVLSWRAADRGSVVLASLRDIAEAVARTRGATGQ